MTPQTSAEVLAWCVPDTETPTAAAAHAGRWPGAPPPATLPGSGLPAPGAAPAPSFCARSLAAAADRVEWRCAMACRSYKPSTYPGRYGGMRTPQFTMPLVHCLHTWRAANDPHVNRLGRTQTGGPALGISARKKARHRRPIGGAVRPAGRGPSASSIVFLLFTAAVNW